MDKEVIQIMSLSDNSYDRISGLLEQTRRLGGRFMDTPGLAVEGFPRSANTFVVTAIQISWPNMAVRSHSHDSKNLITANGSFPVVSVIRNPLDAISSYSVHISLKSPDKAKNITRLIGMYGDLIKCAANNPNVFVIPFEDVITDIVGTLDLLESRYGLEGRVHVGSDVIFKQTTDLSKGENSTAEAFTKKGHVPRDRDPLHAEVLSELQSPAYEDALNDLIKMYDSIVKNYYQR